MSCSSLELAGLASLLISLALGNLSFQSAGITRDHHSHLAFAWVLGPSVYMASALPIHMS